MGMGICGGRASPGQCRPSSCCDSYSKQRKEVDSFSSTTTARRTSPYYGERAIRHTLSAVLTPFLIMLSVLFAVTMEIDDVYFGDVWLCGGQDNMQMTVAYTENAVAELEAADKYPQIRLFTAGRSYSSVKVDPFPLIRLVIAQLTRTLSHSQNSDLLFNSGASLVQRRWMARG